MIITIIYTFIILISAILFDFSNDKSKRNYVILCSIVLFIISGFRHIDVGTNDTYYYVAQYLSIDKFSFLDIYNDYGKDPTFYALTKMIRCIVITDDYTPYLCVLSAIFVASSGYVIYKYSSNPLLSYVLLLSLGFFSFSMNGLRQTIAISLVLLSYPFLVNRSFLKFCIFVIAASLFHRTALVFLGIYLLTNLRISSKTFWAYVGIVVVGFVYGSVIIKFLLVQSASIDERIESYELVTRSLTYSSMIQYIMLLMLSGSFYKNAVKDDSSNIVLYNMLIIAVMSCFYATYIAEFFRISYYFGMFIMLLLPNALKFASANDKMMLTYASIFLLLFYFLVFGPGTYPYKFFFQ